MNLPKGGTARGRPYGRSASLLLLSHPGHGSPWAVDDALTLDRHFGSRAEETWSGAREAGISSSDVQTIQRGSVKQGGQCNSAVYDPRAVQSGL
jgi:hypothetical protein